MGLEEGEKRERERDREAVVRTGGGKGGHRHKCHHFLPFYIFFSQIAIVKTTVDRKGSVEIRHKFH